jgi:Bacterial Ig-like domain
MQARLSYWISAWSAQAKQRGRRIFAALAAGALLTAAGACGGDGFWKWFWETFGWCGGGVVNSVLFGQPFQCAVPVRPACPEGCRYGYAYNYYPGGQCQWVTDAKSRDCGRTYAVGTETYCTTNCGGLNAALGYDAISAADQTAPAVASAQPATSVSWIAPSQTFRIVFDEAIDLNTARIAGSLADEAQLAVERTNQLNDTVTVAPAKAWPIGSVRTLQISVADEAGNLQSITYIVSVRDLAQEEAVALAAIQNRAQAEGVALTGGLQRIQDASAFYHFGEYTLPFQAPQSTVIYAHAAGTFRVYGSIFHHFAALGYHESWLGAPVSDEYDCGILVRCANFAGGYIRADVLGVAAYNY